jgi:hypothetical protein
MPGCLIGPIFEFSDYIKYIERSFWYKNIPSTVMATLKEFGRAALVLIIYIPLSKLFRA